MNILVINGSPKGENSITLQTVRYIEKVYAAHTFEVLHAGQKIRALEKDFAPALEMVRRADLLLFAYPVYTFIAPSQLHRFIELLKASGADLEGKFASQITTSKHFYDMTAHRYIQDNCQDMGMKVIRGLSADMDDLLCPKGQKDARDFFEFVCFSMERDVFEPFAQQHSASQLRMHSARRQWHRLPLPLPPHTSAWLQGHGRYSSCHCRISAHRQPGF